MTLPPSLSGLDSDTESEQELTRVTVLVGATTIDVGLPTHTSIAAVIGDVIEMATDQMPGRTDSVEFAFDNSDGKWTFARLGGGAIDPSRSLAAAGVYDGDVLVVTEAGVPAAALLFDDVEHAPVAAEGRRPWFAENAWAASWFGIGAFSAVVTGLLLSGPAGEATVAGVPIAAVTALAVGIAFAVTACVLPYRSDDTRTSPWIAAAALPLIFGASLHVVPGGFGVGALPMALALTALVSLLTLLISGRGRALFTAIVALALLGVPAALAELLSEPNPRAVGAILATVAVIVVYLAPRATIMLSKLPVPRVPTAGEPLDDIETHGGTAVEGVNAIGKQVIPTEAGMTQRVRRANEYLTGIIAAAAVAAVVGCYLAIDVTNGFFWQGTAFAVAVATVLCLRGRGHHDLVQSATLVGGGLAIALALIVKTATHVDGWQVNAAVALAALMALVAACGLVATRTEFSPVMRRWVEILEYVAIAFVFPLACWILRLYAFFRELRI